MSLETAVQTERERLRTTVALSGSDEADQNGSGAGTDALDQVLTQPEAARFVRLSVRMVQRLDEEGRFVPRIRLTERRIGYWRRDVEDWLAARTAPAKHKDAAA